MIIQPRAAMLLWCCLLVSVVSPTPSSCLALWQADTSLQDGWYLIDPMFLNQSFWVYCDMYHGGWTQVPPVGISYTDGSVVVFPPNPPMSNPDLYPQLQMSFHGWGMPPALLQKNVTYNLTATQVQRIRAISTQATQSLYFHCKANLVNATYGCTINPTFYPTHVGVWKDWYFQDIYPTVLNDGCCFQCCRNKPLWDSSLITFTQLSQIPVTNVMVRHSGAPGEWYLLEPVAAWFQ
jgi:hypothetical protein